MIFKPRIFISSTLSENLGIRSSLERFFTSIGAEAMIYERNLTPSVNNMSYRKDILDADFIIFIIKNNYGTRTEIGISGTHEELQIALENNIPKHVYIKLESDKNDAKELIEEINNNQVSFYYFKTDKMLLKRIRETTFTVAKEIMLHQIDNSQIPRRLIKKISVDHDYDKATEIIKIIEAMLHINRFYEIDFIDSTLFDSFIWPIAMYHENAKWTFIDRKMEEILEELISIYNKFNPHAFDYTCIPKEHITFEVPVLGEVTVDICSASNPTKLSRSDYSNIIKEFLEKYIEFKEYVGRMRLFVDTIDMPISKQTRNINF